jgi:hypothetical protein
MAAAHTRALTDVHPTKLTSTRCLSARQPNPGRRSTYRRGDSVQTSGATSDYAKQTYGIDLDWSDDSVQQVERIAALLHDDYKKTQPSSEQIAPFYKMLGSYVGELFRRNHGAEWGWVTLQGDRFPGMQRKPDSLFWPWGKALNRIVNGPEDNLWHYYRVLLR